VPSDRCTSRCTSNAENANPDPLAQLAAVLLALSPADRARLVAMLTEQGETDAGKGGPTVKDAVRAWPAKSSGRFGDAGR
jgi:hypothetical protein